MPIKYNKKLNKCLIINNKNKLEKNCDKNNRIKKLNDRKNNKIIVKWKCNNSFLRHRQYYHGNWNKKSKFFGNNNNKHLNSQHQMTKKYKENDNDNDDNIKKKPINNLLFTNDTLDHQQTTSSFCHYHMKIKSKNNKYNNNNNNNIKSHEDLSKHQYNKLSWRQNSLASVELLKKKQNLLYRSRSLPHLYTRENNNDNNGNGSASTDRKVRNFHSRLVSDLRQLLTLKQHYYPEGGWGWIILIVSILIQIISHGIHGAVGIFIYHISNKFDTKVYLHSGWLGAMSTSVALLISPVTISYCRRKSTRITAVLGGLTAALGCLFTSFASQFHQLFFSYGIVIGVGVGITRDCSDIMIAQYFKRRRELVEIFIVSGSGLGISIMSTFIKLIIGKIGWRFGLQAVTVLVFLTFILGTFYRSASLYHPQRRAILHLKNQKRKIKDKNKVDDKPPFFDLTALKSKTIRILLLSTALSAFGITTPIFFLAHQIEEDGLGDTVIILQMYLGLAWVLGCITFGLLIVQHSVECRIGRQYLTQTAVFMCGICILALAAVHVNYHGYVMFIWIYGIFCGGYHYSLKMYTYERVRARNFAKTWGYVQCSQAIPIAIGIPLSGYINIGYGGKAGYYFSSTCVLVGSLTLFFINLHKWALAKQKQMKPNDIGHLCIANNCPQKRRLSFNQELDKNTAASMLGNELDPTADEFNDALGVVNNKPELTCISEEGIADMDLPDNILEDMDDIGDCITSCNKVENYLMLSEFENNLIAEMPIMDRKGRRWSLAKSKGLQNSNSNNIPNEDDEIKLKWHLMSAPTNNRIITVIDEASTSQIENLDTTLQ